MAQLQGEHYLLSKRDTVEKKRLDYQDKMITKVRGGQVLDPLIPKENVHKIADVATGTGIWLSDVAVELFNYGSSNLELTGFDISSTQFPKVPKSGFEFVVCDMFKPFPAKYHKSFDLVHVRLVVLVVKVEQLRFVLENILTLLKPGGYIQWDDFDWQDDLDRMFPGPLQEEGAEVLKFFRGQSWSTNLLADISKELKTFPIEDVEITDYVSTAYGHPELQCELAEWHRQLNRAVLPPMYMRNEPDKNKEEAWALMKEYENKVDDMDRKGAIFPMPLMTLIGRLQL